MTQTRQVLTIHWRPRIDMFGRVDLPFARGHIDPLVLDVAVIADALQKFQIVQLGSPTPIWSERALGSVAQASHQRRSKIRHQGEPMVRSRRDRGAQRVEDSYPRLCSLCEGVEDARRELRLPKHAANG